MRVWLAIAVAALAVPATASGGTVFLLDGRGWGHGVGMSQWGAEGYARHGLGYRQILAHYYPHTHIGTEPDRDVRVLLEQGQDSVRVGSAAPFVVVDARGRKLHLPARSVVIDRRFTLRHKRLAQPLTFQAGAQPLQVDFAGYRGDVVVKAKPDGLMAINVLPLDRYLRGVVPWETPAGWHPATYEAQAVAARSFTLATLKPTADFDLYADTRSQMYGGIRAERPQTNLAVGATAGQVLVYRDTIIPAYYFSTSGGKTSSIHDAWPWAKQVPYLVSVDDPYDYLSPHHVWPTEVLTAARVDDVLGVSGVRDMRVVLNSSGRAKAVRVRTSTGWRTFSGNIVRTKFHLGSTDFDVSAMDLDTPERTVYGGSVHVTGFVRGLGKARLQELTQAGWVTVRHLRVRPDGRFATTLPAGFSAELRLAYNSVAGDPVALQVAPRVLVQADGSRLHAVVKPYLPLQVQRLTRKAWRPVARADGSFDRRLGPGSYRVAVLGGSRFAPTMSAPVALHVSVTGP
ncbi:MAG TPA: SpoIID/LytB domain-containing protein [Gaiellaceae bacterium]|nr:SpoIID/LytB domain-containing protein [Gaiellaceae bacterium]